MLKERVRFFAKDILYYGIGNMLYSIVQFISMPLVVKNMDKGQVADWNIILPTGVLLAAIVIFGTDSATVRFLKDAKDDKEEKLIFSTGFIFQSTFGVILAVSLGLFFYMGGGTAFNLSRQQIPSWVILMCWLPGFVLTQYFQSWFKYTFRRKLFLRLISIHGLVYLAGIIFLKYTGRLNLFNVMLVMMVSQWLSAAAGFIACRQFLIFRINKALLKALLRYGAPFMLMAFGFNFIMSMDRYILVGKLSREEFAVYTQAVRISAMVTMVISSFNFAFGPFSLSILGKPEAEKTFSRFHSYYLIMMCFIGLSFLAFGKLVIYIFAGSDYLGGYDFLLFFVAGHILYGLYSFAQLGIIYSKKSYLGIYVLIVGMATCAAIGLILSNFLKGYGTAIAFVVANIVMVLMANYYSKKYLHVKYNLVKDIVLMGIFVVVGYGFMYVNFSDNILYDGIIKFSGLLIILPFVFFTVLTDEEKGFLRRKVFKGKVKEL